MITRWQRYQRLDREEKRMFWHAAAALPLVSMGLRIAGFNRLQTMIARFSPSFPETDSLSDAQWGSARSIARMIEAAGREIWPCTRCLERSMAAWWLMRRRGLPAQLRIGVRKDDGTLRAHAWVEIRGLVLNDNAEIYRGYTAFARAIELASQTHSKPSLQQPQA